MAVAAVEEEVEVVEVEVEVEAVEVTVEEVSCSHPGPRLLAWLNLRRAALPPDPPPACPLPARR